MRVRKRGVSAKKRTLMNERRRKRKKRKRGERGGEVGGGRRW